MIELETYFKLKLFEELVVYGVIFTFIALCIILLILSFIKGKIEDLMVRRMQKQEKKEEGEKDETI